ncbi:MAG: hypothetical protein JXA25_07940 [Anaerolineales bacterium]|nr:hypothetical protein [Anaerolineales bacterium]
MLTETGVKESGLHEKLENGEPLQMEVGMLWFDNDSQRSLPERIEKAAQYYYRKYGRDASVCYLNPAGDVVELPGMVGEIRILSSKKILPDHFWIGVGKPA